jgi:hypothetical protein
MGSSPIRVAILEGKAERICRCLLNRWFPLGMCFDYTVFRHFALVVQRIEQQPSKLWVAGSIPAERAIWRFYEKVYSCQSARDSCK